MYKELSNKLTKVLEKGTSTQVFFDTADLMRGENSVLGYLFKIKDGATIGELQQAARVGSGRISDLVNQLVKKHYVQKKKDTYDKRTNRVYILSEGITFIHNQHDLMTEKITKTLEKLTVDEAKQFINLIEKLS